MQFFSFLSIEQNLLTVALIAEEKIENEVCVLREGLSI